MGALMLCTGAHAQTIASGTPAQGYLLLDDARCEILVQPGEYEGLFALTDALFAARTAEGWLLLGEEGTALSEEIWEDVYEENGVLLCKKDGLYGVYGLDLSTMYEHVYTQIVSNGQGGFLALKTEPNDERGDGVYLLDGKGGETATGTVIVYGLNPFSCDRSAAVGSGGKRTGYLAPDGTWAITAQYGYGAAFVQEGLAVASADSGAGVIDVDGNWIISPKYETVLLSEENRLLAVSVGERMGLYDIRERAGVLEFVGAGACARTRDLIDMALVTMDGTAALYSYTGTKLAEWSEESGASVSAIGKEHLLLYKNGAEYLLDAQANTLAGPYEDIALLEEGRFCARRQDGCDLLDEGGRILAETPYDAVISGAQGLYVAWKDGEALLIGPDGQMPGAAEK